MSHITHIRVSSENLLIIIGLKKQRKSLKSIIILILLQKNPIIIETFFPGYILYTDILCDGYETDFFRFTLMTI